MIPLDYQNPLHVAPPRRRSRWQPYFGGAITALIASFLIWMILLGIWPHRLRWQILEFPDMFACDAIGDAVALALSTGIYCVIASPLQFADRHFLHGLLAGLTLMSVTNFLQRAENAQLAPPEALGAIQICSIIITPIFLGWLSRHYAKKQEAMRLTN